MPGDRLPELLQTEDRAFVRSTSSHALLSTDRAALERNRGARRKALEREQLERRVESLDAQVAELKTLVLKLLNGA